MRTSESLAVARTMGSQQLKLDQELSLVLRTSESLLFARAKRSNPEKHGDPSHSLSANGGAVGNRAWVRGRRDGLWLVQLLH